MAGIKAKMLYDKIPFVFEMIKEILITSVFDDEKRLYEIIARMKSRLQMGLAQAGHSTAVKRALSYFSANAYYQEQIAGVEFYKVIDELESNFEAKKGELISNLKTLMKLIFREENLTVSCTADEEGCNLVEKELPSFKKCLFDEPAEDTVCTPIYEVKNLSLIHI